MAIYYIIVLILVCLYIFLEHIKLKGRKTLFLICTFLLLSFISCLRDVSVGTDTEQFMTSYSVYSSYGFEIVSFNQTYEPGFMFYIWLLSRFTSDARIFIVFTYLFINFAIINFISRYSKDYFLSVLIYILSCQFLASMCMLRQFMAISIVLIGFRYLLDKKYIKFSVIVLMATMFHYFAFLFILLIPMHKLKNFSRAQFICICVVFIGVFVLLPDIILFIIDRIPNYSDYKDYLISVGEYQGTLRIPPMLLVMVALFVPYIVNYKTWHNNKMVLLSKGNEWSFLNIVYTFLLFLVILAGRFNLFTRVYYYYTPFFVLLPNFQDLTNKNGWRIYIILVLIAIFTVSLLLGRGTYDTENYKFFWQ